MARRPPTHDKREFNPVQVSPSRINAYLSCGQAFEMKYVQGVPEQISGSAALFGSVVHHALERWAVNRSQDLVSLMAQAWLAETEGTSVNDFIGAYQAICVQVMKAEAAARDEWEARPANKGKTSKAPRMTNTFKESPAAKKEAALLAQWLPRLRNESPWRFNDRDPLPSLYNESLVLAKRYAAKWNHLPPALTTEFGFDVKWEGFILNGYIDAIEMLGEKEGIFVCDYKTYAKEPPEQKDWRQLVIYDVAIRELAERDVLPNGIGQLIREGIPVYVGADYPRLLERKYWQITKADHARLKEELTMYLNGVTHGVFLPAEKGRNPDFCPYPDNCCLKTKGDGLAIPVEVAQ